MKQISKLTVFPVLIVLLAFISCDKNEVTDLSLSKSSITLNVGQSDSVVATITLSGDIKDQPVTWTATTQDIVSIKESVVPVGTSGNMSTHTLIVTALKTGTTTISFQSGGKTTTCQATVGQANYIFSMSYAYNYGDLYETGNNIFGMYLLENTLSVNDSGNLDGTGTLIYLDFNMPITQNSLIAGSFSAANSGELNTFFPGEIIDYKGESLAIGTRITTFGTNSGTTTLATDGNYTITAQGSNFVIEGDLTLENNEIIHFSYTGPVTVSDEREVPVELTPAFTKGELVYYGDAYETNLSNNFVAYLATEGVNFKDSILNGEVLMMELNTPLTVKNYIPNGTYTMLTQINKIEDLAPNTLVYGYTTEDGDQWGCWYYGETTKSLRTGNITVNKTGDNYTIQYSLLDRFGSKVSGTFTGPLTYLDATAAAPSSVSAAKIRRAPMTKEIPVKKINQHARAVETFRIRK